jgi:hypothetical protein
MAIMVLRTCQQVEGGLPADVTYKMYFNIIFDFGIGLVPFLGDIADGTVPQRSPCKGTNLTLIINC